MKRTSSFVGLSLLALTAPLLAQEKVTVEGQVQKMDLSDRSNPPPVAPVTAMVTLEGADVLAGKLKAGSKELAVQVSQSDGSALPNGLAIDFDGNGKMTEGETFAMTCQSREQRGATVVLSDQIEGTFPSGVSFGARFVQQGERPPMVQFQFLTYFAAELDSGKVAILDQDFDGTFGSKGDMWTLAGAGARPASAYALSAIGEGVFQDGHRITIAVKGNEVTVTKTAAAGPDPKDAAAHRARVEHLWAERFDAEREGFVTARGLDTTRALAKKPVEWKYLTFDDAIALGKKEGKPVFIDVMAFWCVWCYRMDYYTYPDAEVAQSLSKDFIPVKVIQEQDLAGDYDKLMKDKLKARGIPAMGIFDGEGNVIHQIGGWKKPEDFLKELETAKKAFSGQ